MKRFHFQLATGGEQPLYLSQLGSDVEVFTNGVANFFPAEFRAQSLVHVASIANPTGFAVMSEKYTDKSNWVEEFDGASMYSLVIGGQLKALTSELLKYFPYEKVGFKLYRFDPHAGLGSVIVAEFDADLIVPFTTVVYNGSIYALQAFFQDGTNDKRAVSLALPNFDKSKIVFQHYVLLAYTDKTSGSMKDATRYTVYPKDENGDIRSDLKLAVRECRNSVASFVAYTLDPPISFSNANEVGVDYILVSRVLSDSDPQALADFTVRLLTSDKAIGGYAYVDFGGRPVDAVKWAKGKEGIEGTLVAGKNQINVRRLFCIPL